MTAPERVLDLRVGARRVAAALHDAGSGPIVLFCHGFRGERTGPSRSFVRAARQLAVDGVSSLRFDQIGSGDSDGDFLDLRFDGWVDTISMLIAEQRNAGRAVALFGQSMGAAAAIVAAASVPVEAVVAWVPDPKSARYRPDGRGFMEEGGQRVADAYWEQAHATDVIDALRRCRAPVHLVLATEDEYVSRGDHESLISAVRPQDRVEVLEGLHHSAWTHEQFTRVIASSLEFLLSHLAPE